MATNFRHQAFELAKETIALKPVYLDTETTGLGASSEIVDICILDHKCRILVDTLVKPKCRIPSDAIAIHGITNAMVADAPTWPEIWPQVKLALSGQYVAIYNADYDVRLMKQTLRKYHLSWRLVDTEFLCVMRLYAQFYGEWNPYYGSFRWQKLENAGIQCKIKLPNSHRARADALLARAVLQYMAKCAK